MLAVGAAGVLWAPQASAAQIVVNFSSSTTTAPNLDDGKCDIVEAVQAANTDTAVHTNDCPAGAGADEIVLSLNGVYRVNQTLRLTSDTSVTVANGGRATIKPANSWISGSLFGSDCMIYAEADTVVSLTRVNLTGNNNSGVTGFGSKGTSTLNRVNITNFLKSGAISWSSSDGGSAFHIESSSIAYNYTPMHGGGVALLDAGAFGELKIDNSIIKDNSSDGIGGGIFMTDTGGIHRITNSTISGNYATVGGGIGTRFDDSVPAPAVGAQIFNSTIVYNQAGDLGGGIYHRSEARALEIFASLVIGNTASGLANVGWDLVKPDCFDNSIVYVPPGVTTPRQADVAGEQCRFDIVPPGTENTVIGPLMPMGGNEVLVYPLLAGSPAIDAVVNSTMITQQRDNFTQADASGQPGWMLWDRNVDGDSNGTARRDVGAYEYNLRWQTELLPVSAIGLGGLTQVVASGWDRGAGLLYSGTDAVNRFITPIVWVQDAAPRKVKVGYRRTTTGGKYQLAVADSATGPWTNVGGVKDTYGTTHAFLEHDITGSGFAPFTGVGAKYFRFTVISRPAGEAGGYDLNLDYIQVTP